MAEKKLEEKLEDWGNRIAKSINYDRLTLWKEVFFHPTDVLTAEQKNANLGRAAKDVFIASLPAMLFGFIFVLIGFLYFGMVIFAIAISALQEYAATIGTFALIALLLLIALYFLVPVICWLVSSAVQFIVAKIFGGKSSFRTHAYLTGISTSAVKVATIPFILLSLIPCVGYIATPLVTVIGFYLYYLEYKSIKIAHKLSDVGAIISTFSSLLLWVIAIAAGVLLFYLGIFMAIMAESAGS